jgi:L-asparagine permease
VVLLMPFSDKDQRVAFFLIPALVVAIAAGWMTVRRRRS